MPKKDNNFTLFRIICFVVGVALGLLATAYVGWLVGWFVITAR